MGKAKSTYVKQAAVLWKKGTFMKSGLFAVKAIMK